MLETEDKGAIVPTWTAIEPHNVLTLSELWTELLSNNWNIQVCIHIPLRRSDIRNITSITGVSL